MDNEEIKKYRKARPTIDSCIDDAVEELLTFKAHMCEDYDIKKIYFRRICWQLAEDSVDAYVGNLELDMEESA